MVYFTEASGAPELLIHGLDLGLVFGRLSHAYGVSQVDENFRFRVSAIAMTFSTLGVCAGYLLHRA